MEQAVQKNVERDCRRCVCHLTDYDTLIPCYIKFSEQSDPAKFWGDMAKQHLTWKVHTPFRMAFAI